MKFALAAVVACSTLFAQSPTAETSVTVNGKRVAIKYSAPSVRGRKIFGPGGLLSNDPTYPVWRAGANSATSLHTDADLEINGLSVRKGDYSLYVLVSDPDRWQLIVNKEVNQWGLVYHEKMDVGRVKMLMSKPGGLIETYKMTLTPAFVHAAKLQLEWERHIALVTIVVK